jgi:hypothetical protein
MFFLSGFILVKVMSMLILAIVPIGFSCRSFILELVEIGSGGDLFILAEVHVGYGGMQLFLSDRLKVLTMAAA